MLRFPAKPPALSFMALFSALFVGAVVTLSGCTSPSSRQAAPDDPFAPIPEPPVTRVAVDPARSIDALKEAIRLLKEGQFAQADANLEEVRRVRPEIPEVHFNLGWAKIHRQKYKEALAHFDDGLKLRPGEISAYVQRGLAYRELGQFAEAEKTYLDGLALAPDNDHLHFNLAILYDLYLGDPAKALEHYLAYQKLQAVPDIKVTGWITVLERDAKKREAAQIAPVESPPAPVVAPPAPAPTAPTAPIAPKKQSGRTR